MTRGGAGGGVIIRIDRSVWSSKWIGMIFSLFTNFEEHSEWMQKNVFARLTEIQLTQTQGFCVVFS